MQFVLPWFGRLFTDSVDKIGKRKQQDKKNRIDCEFGMHEKPFRFLHRFFFFERFPKKQEKIEENEGGEV